ncbi:DUF2946 domain-containing protein [Undibacterium oligocarboniphilum]|uniref:DUF2946 domain-containing protein n=1 Tax=Undibacterium oligocarboniphilum TaxID=666702 RepID=A0A850QPS6_9BURK|nr:DUF2946 domain-containing protein [Undibacterium oligocarboniphilum]NVO78086.1 DUF2946 domain-containing protein [Undibacterium oligocarboniphilum]
MIYFSDSHKKRIAWLLIGAMLFAFIAPSLLHSLSTRNPGTDSICSATNSFFQIKHLFSEKTDFSPSDKHCALCLLSLDSENAYPPVSNSYWPDLIRSRIAVVPEDNVVPSDRSYSAYQTRAPPAC